MRVGRRTVIKWLGVAGLAMPGLSLFGRTLARASGPAVGMRTVAAGDAADLQAIMTSCVKDADAFFGQCGEWPLSWAQEFVLRCPNSPVLTSNGTAVAFMEVPPIKPAPAQAAENPSAEERARLELRARNRTTFRVTAAGVRFDLLGEADANTMFRTVLYEALKAARALGYEYVEAWAPWEQHPILAHKWTDYPGCELTQPVAHNQEGGHDIYCIRWQLDAAIKALAAEERFDVA